VEWYLTKVIDARLDIASLGGPGSPAPAPLVSASAHGFQYLLEDHNDELDHVLHPLFQNLSQLGLPVRSMENEWGPGQVEITFEPLVGLAAADAMTLFRAATRQVCRRLGYHATFMCKPAFESFYSSGWHLHQSLAEPGTGRNLFASSGSADVLSEVGTGYVGGLLRHARPASVFSTPTINGYRRVKPNSLAPIQASWALDNRGAMIRVQGRPGDPGAHIENRVGEPAANPYLYMASQLTAGLDGVVSKADPGPLLDEPYAQRLGVPLPTSLAESLDALEESALYRSSFGDTFVDFIIRMKRSEVERYETYLKTNEMVADDTVTDWEQREYFRLF
jgi:glutamine synthetase